MILPVVLIVWGIVQVLYGTVFLIVGNGMSGYILYKHAVTRACIDILAGLVFLAGAAIWWLGP